MKGEDNIKHLKIVVASLVALDALVWFLIIFPADSQDLELYFLDVGQGDSSLIIMPGGPKLLIDGGQPNGKLQANLENILPVNDRYIDLVMISHPQLDHFGGFVELVKDYKVGAVLLGGQTSQSSAWQELELVIREKEVARITLFSGDRIKYLDSQISILSPEKNGWARDVNDLSLVALLESEGAKVLFTGDISDETERRIADKYDVDADILKVSHHGSKYSSDWKFLSSVTPLISVIEVGKNSYGHPTGQTLARLASFGSQIYRTDLNGLVKITANDGKIRVFSGE